MTTQLLELDETSVDVVHKDIKNLHLCVHPPSGRVRIAAPKRIANDAVRLFAILKLDWIKEQQRKLAAQDREALRQYLERESHCVWGKRYLLSIAESDQPVEVSLTHERLCLRMRPCLPTDKRREVLEAWYREQLRDHSCRLITQWEPKLGVEVEKLFVRRMKTRWGSCNSQSRTIRLNTDLATKPPKCLEFLVVHEMLHILEPTHNERFQILMRQHMPDWEHRRRMLNDLPAEDWLY